MSWVDLLLVIVVATVTVLGAQRRLAGLLVGLGGLLLLRPLIVAGHASPLVALVLALLAGLVLSLVGRRLFRQNRGGDVWKRALGGLGGFVLGSAIVVALVVSFPIQRNPANPNELFYPPRNLPAPLQEAVLRSRLVMVGRDILLYPLLARQGDVAGAEGRVVRGLHRWFVVGEPWNES